MLSADVLDDRGIAAGVLHDPGMQVESLPMPRCHLEDVDALEEKRQCFVDGGGTVSTYCNHCVAATAGFGRITGAEVGDLQIQAVDRQPLLVEPSRRLPKAVDGGDQAGIPLVHRSRLGSVTRPGGLSPLRSRPRGKATSNGSSGLKPSILRPDRTARSLVFHRTRVHMIRVLRGLGSRLGSSDARFFGSAPAASAPRPP